MTVTKTANRLELHRSFPYPAEKVFDAWADAEGMRQWMRPVRLTLVRRGRVFD